MRHPQLPDGWVELRADFDRIAREVKQIERHIAWNRVIDSAIRLCRVLAKAEEAEAAKFNPNWASQPRVPKQNPDGGQWAAGGGGNLHLTGGGSRRGPQVPGSRAPGASGLRYRLGTGEVEIPPDMEVPVRTALDRAETAVARAQRGDPEWRPQPELSRPQRTPQEVIAFANRVEEQAEKEITRQADRMGHNQGPSLDEPSLPSQLAPSSFRDAFDSNNYRTQLGLPKRQGEAAWRKGEGTVAYTEFDGEAVFGVNSTAPSYTHADRIDAMNMREILIAKYPELMNMENVGWKPNDALFHGEATLLFRAARIRGGTLKGQSIDVQVDRVMCGGCGKLLPKVGEELGNPSVSFTDSYGNVKIMKNGRWEN